MKQLQRIRKAIRIPARDDLVLAAGAVVLTVAVLLLAGLPLLNRLEARARLVALKGNAATVQLAAESFARQHLGRYPRSVSELTAYLPGGKPPENPLAGGPVTFTRKPGDITYTPLEGEGGYLIEAWSFGKGRQCRRVLALAAGSGAGRSPEGVIP